MLLHDGKELESHPTGLFRARLPLLHRAFIGVEIAREYRLAHVALFAQLLDLRWLDSRRHDEAAFVEVAHRCFVDSADFVKRRRGSVNALANPALELTFCRHDQYPKSYRLQAAKRFAGLLSTAPAL
jgi:hypothetical protein